MVKVTIHETGAGTDSLTGKEQSDGLTVSFDDGSVDRLFLSWKSFRQLLNLKTKVRNHANDPSLDASETGRRQAPMSEAEE